MARIFLSYRREDGAAYVHLLDSRLRARFKRDDVFVDVRSVGPGEDFVDAIVRTVGSSDVLIAVIGKRWAGEAKRASDSLLHDPEDFVRLEVETALARGLHVVPALVGGARMPDAEALPETLQPLLRRNAFTLDDARLEEDVDRLVGSLAGRVRKRRRTGRIVAVVAGAVALALVAGVGWQWLGGGLKPAGETEVASPPVDSGEAPGPDPETKPESARSQAEDEKTSPGAGAPPEPLPWVLDQRIVTQTPGKNAHFRGIFGLAFSRDGRRLASAEADGEPWYETTQTDGVVRLWDVETGEALSELRVPDDRTCSAVAFVGDDRLAAACEGGTVGAGIQFVRIWDLTREEVRKTLVKIDPVDGNYPIRFVAYSASRDRILARGGNERYNYAPPETPAFANLRTWDAESGELDVALRIASSRTAPALSPDGERIAVPTHDGLELRRVADGELLRAFDEIRLDIDSVAFGPTGEEIVVGSSKQYSPEFLLFVDPETGAVTRSLELPGQATGLSLHTEGQLAAVAIGGEVRILHLADGSVIQRIPAWSYWNRTARFSRDGRRLAIVADQGTIEIYRENPPS